MYALIYDENDPTQPMKRVVSVHKSRKTAENALRKRQKQLGRRVWDCNTRIVWVEGRVKASELLSPTAFKTWGPGEKAPWGETHSDSD